MNQSTKRQSFRIALSPMTIAVMAIICIAQRPPMRRHTANKKGTPTLVQADRKLRSESQVSVSESRGYRVFRVNGIPDHKVGQFPNRGNPHSISERVATFRVPLETRRQSRPTQLRLGQNFGIAVNGVLFDPLAAEFWLGNPRGGWQYEALGGAVPLGLDANYAHVQPDGKYHYHGVPYGLLESLGFDRKEHSPLVGWASDGFPIYALNGYTTGDDTKSAIKELKPSYRLKSGRRPGGTRGDQFNPGGSYDGTFINDYEFVKGLGDLDECNGRFCITPEFPEGTYAYFLTRNWPTIPRLLRGTGDPSFQNRMGPPGRGGFRPGPPPRRRPQ